MSTGTACPKCKASAFFAQDYPGCPAEPGVEYACGTRVKDGRTRQSDACRIAELEAGYKKVQDIMGGKPEDWEMVLKVVMADGNCATWMTTKERVAMEHDLSYANHVIGEKDRRIAELKGE